MFWPWEDIPRGKYHVYLFHTDRFWHLEWADLLPIKHVAMKDGPFGSMIYLYIVKTKSIVIWCYLIILNSEKVVNLRWFVTDMQPTSVFTDTNSVGGKGCIKPPQNDDLNLKLQITCVFLKWEIGPPISCHQISTYWRRRWKNYGERRDSILRQIIRSWELTSGA